jgi:phospholipase/carboxylesterase
MQAASSRYHAIVVQQACGQPQQLFVLAHGFGANAADLVPLAERIARAFPHSTVVSIEAPLAAGNPGGYQWFPLAGISEANRGERIRDAMPGFCAEIRAWQRDTGAIPAITALVGFSQGAMMALESTVGTEVIAARVVAISGRFAALPAQVPEQATFHLLHGKEDGVVPCRHTVDAAHRLLELGGDVTADIVPFIGHEIDDELIDLLLQRLRSHVPKRIWQEAMRDVPPPAPDTKN